MGIQYTITSHCDDTECIGYGSRIRGQNRHVSSFESCTLLDGDYDIDVHELIEITGLEKFILVIHARNCQMLQGTSLVRIRS